jgi:hypothetical protein
MDRRVRDTVREQLLNQYLPPPEKMDQYRKEVYAMLERQEAGLRREKKMVATIWVIVVGLATVFMIVGGMRSETLSGIWLGISACFWFLFGTVFLIRYHINRSRIELLKELKQTQLQVLELIHKQRPADEQP